jgi:hypothetical protein
MSGAPRCYQAAPAPLAITSVDSAPTGLVLITNLAPNNSSFCDPWLQFSRSRNHVLDIGRIGIRSYVEEMKVESTAALAPHGSDHGAFLPVAAWRVQNKKSHDFGKSYRRLDRVGLEARLKPVCFLGFEVLRNHRRKFNGRATIYPRADQARSPEHGSNGLA